MSKFIDHDLNLRVTQLKEAAEALPQGDAREALIYRATKIEAASLGDRNMGLIARPQGTEVASCK